MNIIKIDYAGSTIEFREDGWFNATEAAARFGKRVNDFLSLPATKEYITALDYDTDPNTRKSGIWVKTKRGNNGGTWLHPDLAVQFARWIDVKFSIWCDRQIRQILSNSHPHYDWKRIRHEASSSFKVMNAVLLLQRQQQGKVSKHHHFSNEARLVNWALTGAFKSLDRDSLTSDELDLLAKLEERNAVLIGCGLDYDERKLALERFAKESRPVLALVV